MSTDGSQSDEAFSDEGDDDSDDDFVSDDDDFKGKKTKKSNLSRIKKGPAAMAKAPRNATAQSQRPAPVTVALELGNAFFMHCADVMSRITGAKEFGGGSCRSQAQVENGEAGARPCHRGPGTEGSRRCCIGFEHRGEHDFGISRRVAGGQSLAPASQPRQ